MECRLTDIRLFVAVLQSLQLENRKGYTVNVNISRDGMRLSGITQALDVQVECVMPGASFQEFRVAEDRGFEAMQVTASLLEEGHSTFSESQRPPRGQDDPFAAWNVSAVLFSFNIPLSSFIHYVRMFGAGATMLFKYSPTENLVNLTLSDRDGRSECHLHVMAPDPPPCFLGAEEVDRNIFSIQPRRFKDALVDLQENGDPDSRVILEALPRSSTAEEPPEPVSSSTPPPHIFSMLLLTQSSSCHIAFPYSRLLFPHFQVDSVQRHAYNLKSLLALQKSLGIAASCQVKFLRNGVCHVILSVKSPLKLHIRFALTSLH